MLLILAGIVLFILCCIPLYLAGHIAVALGAQGTEVGDSMLLIVIVVGLVAWFGSTGSLRTTANEVRSAARASRVRGGIGWAVVFDYLLGVAVASPLLLVLSAHSRDGLFPIPGDFRHWVSLHGLVVLVAVMGMAVAGDLHDERQRDVRLAIYGSLCLMALFSAKKIWGANVPDGRTFTGEPKTINLLLPCAMLGALATPVVFGLRAGVRRIVRGRPPSSRDVSMSA